MPVEFTYYLVIPFLAVWMRGPSHWAWRALGVLGLILLSSIWFPAAQAPLNSDRLVHYLPVLVCGSIAAWVAHQTAFVNRQRDLTAVQGALELAPVLMLVLSVPSVFVALRWFDDIDALHRSFLGWGVFWALLLLAVVSGRLQVWQRVMRWRGFRACGRWCFGIYLLHMPALYLARKLPLPSGLAAWLGLALALALAAASFRLIERPAMNLVRRSKPVQ